MPISILKGQPYPRGATYDGKGVNFALFSSSAEKVEVCLFDKYEKKEVRIELPAYTDEVFHGYIPNLKPGQLYGYRVYGPFNPEKGFRFNPNKLLIDPYAKQLTRAVVTHNSMLGYLPSSKKLDLSFSRQNSAPYMPKCVIIDDTYNWQNVQKPNIPWDDMTIYETHVKGFTAKNPEIDSAIRGTFAGLSTKSAIDYIKSLGIKSIELLPIASFMQSGFLKQKGLTNYWGYDPVAFMAPHAPYLSGNSLHEIKTMVRLFHEAGVEVILDVVYNHTGEGNHMGETLCYRGIDNSAYYRLNKENPRFYDDTTGCGASFNLGNAHVVQLVMDSLRYWADNMQIDGFRFDLATTLARDENNTYTPTSDFFSVIQQDPILQRLKLIAEPWDLGWEGYQVGSFRPGWAEWNDKFRDTVRRFYKGDEGQANDFASRLLGSSDVYQQKGRKPWASINYITAHDGFSLADLVSYNTKHNTANHENNQDGSDANFSWNGGVEGPTKNKEILKNREDRARSLMASLLLSFGTPMIRGGDEILFSQSGNNNTYAQDNDLSWIDFKQIAPAGKRMQQLVKDLFAFRLSHPIMDYDDFFNNDICTWFCPDGALMSDDDWGNHARALSFLITNKTSDLFFVFNAFDQEITWQIPNYKNNMWRIQLQTSLDKINITSSGQFSAHAFSVTVFEKINL